MIGRPKLGAKDGGGEDDLDRDTLFHLLQSSRRRAVMWCLLTLDDRETYEMRAIAEQITAWENDIPVGDISSQQRQRVYIALYQSHLPKLHDFDVIEYDQGRGTVAATGRREMFEPYLEGEFPRPEISPDRDDDQDGSLGKGVRTVFDALSRSPKP